MADISDLMSSPDLQGVLQKLLGRPVQYNTPMDQGQAATSPQAPAPDASAAASAAPMTPMDKNDHVDDSAPSAPENQIDDKPQADSDSQEAAPQRAPQSKAPVTDDSEDEDDSDEEDKQPDDAPVKPDLNFGSSEQNKSNLADLLKAKEDTIKESRMGRGIQLLQAGILGAKPNMEPYELNNRDAQVPIDDYLLKQKEAATDPNSGLSMGMRDYMKNKLGITVSDGATAEQMGHVVPQLFKQMEMQQAQQARHEDVKAKMAQMADASKQRSLDRQMMMQNQMANRATASDTKQNANDDKELAKMSTEINGLKASSRSAVGSAANAKVKAQRMIDILNDPNATPQDMQSAAADLNSIVSNTTTMSGTEHQTYNNLQTEYANGVQYLLNRPHAADVPQVKQHMKDVANRMVGISDQVIAQNAGTVKAGHAGYVKRHPDEWQDLLNSTSAAAGGSTSGSGDPRDAAALAKIKANNPNITDAEANDALISYKKQKSGQ